MSYQAYNPRPDVSPIEGPSSDFPPPPPAHRQPVGMHPDSQYYQGQSQRQNADPNNYTNYSPPGHGHEMQDYDEAQWERNGDGSRGMPMGVPASREPANTPFSDQYGYDSPAHPRPMYSAAGGMGAATAYSSNSSQRSMPNVNHPYQDSPYNRYSSSNLDLAPQLGQINPNDLADDDDWGMGARSASQQQKRRTFGPFGSSRDPSREGTPGSSIAPGAAAGAGAASSAAALGATTRDGSGAYNAVPNPAADRAAIAEKSEMMNSEKRHRKKRMWIVIAVIAVVVLGAIAGGVAGALASKDGGSSSRPASNAGSVEEDNKDELGINSSEIKKLMNNKDLHKVFPGMDYTPLNAQYPDCIHVGPSQNNITRDMAVMSQLTNAVRLYGTDCNQTEMVLTAIDRLKLTDMKVWLGVWLGNNDTTNHRQIDQMWGILDAHGPDKFKGIIVGNEVLFREDLTEIELLDEIAKIKQNLTDHKFDLKIATSDLGDNWTADMATKVDIVMSNVHPFFAGVDVSEAAGWTWNFWQTKDVVLTKDQPDIKQIVAEVGWPTGGGKSCGQSPTCGSTTPGSVAGVDEMNQFMEDWICPSLKNGTEYFWFSAFDEPWKIRYNEKGKEWEDKWGLMDVDRNLKPGVTIPDCGGASLPS